jgi:hypothetical protein
MIFGKTSLNAVLHWFLGGSTQWLSTPSAGEPVFRVLDTLVVWHETLAELGLESSVPKAFLAINFR